MNKFNVSFMLSLAFVGMPFAYAQENIVDNQEILNDEGYGADDAEYYKSEAMNGNEMLPPQEEMVDENVNLNEDAAYDVDQMNADLMQANETQQ